MICQPNIAQFLKRTEKHGSRKEAWNDERQFPQQYRKRYQSTSSSGSENRWQLKRRKVKMKQRYRTKLSNLQDSPKRTEKHRSRREAWNDEHQCPQQCRKRYQSISSSSSENRSKMKRKKFKMKRRYGTKSSNLQYSVNKGGSKSATVSSYRKRHAHMNRKILHKIWKKKAGNQKMCTCRSHRHSLNGTHCRPIHKHRHSRSNSSSSSSRFSSGANSSARGRGEREDTDISNVVVAAVQYSADGKRIRNKKLVCFICRAEVLWLSRHFERQHSEHFLVAKVLAATGLNRRNGLKRLKNLGSFKHNLDVLKKGVGQILVVRRPKDSHAADEYLPCCQCYGFYHQYELFRHVCPCRANSSSESQKNVIDSSRSLLAGALGENDFVDQHLKQQVLSHMRQDSILRTIKSDRLILEFGSAQLKRIGVKGARRIATRMRLLARLLVSLRSISESTCDLSDFLNGTYYDAIVEAVEELAGLHADDNGQRVFKRPSLVLLVGNILVKCCQNKKGAAIKDDDDIRIKEVDRFMALYTSDWSNTMSCPSLASLKTSSYNKPVELPTTSDLMKLKAYAEEQMNLLTEKLKEEPQYQHWRKLSEVVLTRLLVFNKRRASEPAKLELSEYVNRPQWKKHSNRELIDNLQPLEHKLMERMDMIQVPGKRNRKVPILITPDVSLAMQLLVESRQRCGVSAKNKYFFATDSTNGYLNTWLVLHNHAVAAHVDNPRLITSTRLRKYVATLAQV